MTRATHVFVALAFALGLSACSGGSKCDKLMDKAMSMMTEMATEMAKSMGGGDNAEIDKQMAEAKKEFEAKRPEAIKKCEEALKADPAAEKAVDCILAAEGMEDMMKCEGADKLGEVMK